MSNGGRPSTYYSITSNGREELKHLLLLPPLENPIQFLPNARIKLYCADILNNEEQKELFNLLKHKSEKHFNRYKKYVKNARYRLLSQNGL